MARRNIDTEADVEIDMTPMIDIVFNLIIFFMLVNDMSQKEFENLTLPKSEQSDEDLPNPDETRVIVNIAPELEPGQPLESWKPGDPIGIRIKRQKYDLEGLARELFVWAEKKRDLEHPAKPSEVYMLIRCHEDIRWREVQWVMQAAAKSPALIYKIQFATRDRPAGQEN